MVIKEEKGIFNLSKELGVVDGSPFMLQDITETVIRHQVQPGLLTALLVDGSKKIYNNTNSFRYDAIDYTQQIPEGKAYSAYGQAEITKDKPFQKYFEIPSFGLKYNVAPQDYMNRRKHGTNEVLSEADVVAEMNMKAMAAWANHDEIALAQLITADTNYIASGPFTEYNFYTDIVGDSRSAATAMELDDDTQDHVKLFRMQRKYLAEELEKSGDTVTQYVCICGDTFFNQRRLIEENTGLARPLQFGIDLASVPLPTSTFGSGSYPYDYFDSMDGIRYINYGATIVTGSKLIADTAGYLVPMGAKNLVRMVYAPANTREYVNSQAQELYAWTKIDDRKGVTTFYEKNCLYMSVNPRLIRNLVNC